MFVDMHGKPCAKLVPAAAVDVLMGGGSGFAGFAAGPLGQTPADPDLIARPDPASYTPLPWKPNVAAVQCDPHGSGRLAEDAGHRGRVESGDDPQRHGFRLVL